MQIQEKPKLIQNYLTCKIKLNSGVLFKIPILPKRTQNGSMVQGVTEGKRWWTEVGLSGVKTAKPKYRLGKIYPDSSHALAHPF